MSCTSLQGSALGLTLQEHEFASKHISRHAAVGQCAQKDPNFLLAHVKMEQS